MGMGQGVFFKQLKQLQFSPTRRARQWNKTKVIPLKVNALILSNTELLLITPEMDTLSIRYLREGL